MMPPKRPCRRTNSMLVANRSMQIMYKTVQWKAQHKTLAEIRAEVLRKAGERLTR